jgi:putative glutamine amidotransferase
MGSPVIGITAAIERAGWTVWSDVEANLSPRGFSREVAAAGGVPVLLPAEEAVAAAPAPLIDRLDGLVLAGGADLDPASYHAAPDPHTTGYRAERDRFELALAREALARDLPLLGICRGMEVLNVACGGTLEQNLEDLDIHLHTPGQFSDHEVRLEPGSLTARAIGAERISVRSHHHQGMGELGRGVAASGWSEPDDIVEAIEITDRRFALGILWHAEEVEASDVIASFVDAARVEVAA